MRIALAHVDVRPCRFDDNLATLRRALSLASTHGADMLVTPELALTGYHFAPHCGTAWLKAASDPHFQAVRQEAAHLGVALWLGHAVRDRQRAADYNVIVVFDARGETVGQHRKINTIPGSEAWATKGESVSPIDVLGHRLGALVCADAWPEHWARELARQGAELIVCSANWASEPHGPGDTFERRSAETGLPVVVCNRTGVDDVLDFTTAESSVSVRGGRLFSHHGPDDSLCILDWDAESWRLLDARVLRVPA